MRAHKHISYELLALQFNDCFDRQSQEILLGKAVTRNQLLLVWHRLRRGEIPNIHFIESLNTISELKASHKSYRDKISK